MSEPIVVSVKELGERFDELLERVEKKGERVLIATKGDGVPTLQMIVFSETEEKEPAQR